MRTTLFTRLILIFIIFSQAIAHADYDDTNNEADDDDLPYVEIQSLTDYSSIKTNALKDNKLILLEISASYCGYCTTLEEEIIKPMLRSGDYTNNVYIRQVDVDGAYLVSGDNSSELTAAELAKQLNVKITPTLIFLDGHGNEVSTRIPGVYSLDFYGGYVDAAIKSGLQSINRQH